MAKFKVTLSATLPATAYLEVEAEDEEAARNYADANYADADWMGSDCGDKPQGCDVDVTDVELIP